MKVSRCLWVLLATALRSSCRPEPMVILGPKAPATPTATASIQTVIWDGAAAYCPYCRREVPQRATACPSCTRSIQWVGRSCPMCAGSGKQDCNMNYAVQQLKHEMEQKLGQNLAYYFPGREDRVIACNGTGQGKLVMGNRAGEVVPGPCPTCGGSGKVPCDKCGGSGRIGD
jgi:hypothetical protein